MRSSEARSPDRKRLQAAFDSGDVAELVALLDEHVVWRGVPGVENVDDADAHERHEASGHDDHDHEHSPMCTSREEVRSVFEGLIAGGATGRPVVLAEARDSVVVDPRPVPPLAFPLHQAFTFRGGRVVLIQDYPDRASALAGLEG